jgi:2-dehydropantoate 2-reductase
MNIVVFGAGAIGSFIGALLSKNNNVVLIGRKPHIDVIKKNGLKIKGKTKLKIKINSEEKIDNINFQPDLIILTVKSYDTENAIKEAKQTIKKDTIILPLQNGLDNIEKIKKYVHSKQIISGITTNGCVFSKPGLIIHTGIGKTVFGELDGKKSKRIINIVDMFNESGIKSNISNNIIKEIWIKAIVNSSINPLTTFFKCKNGYLLENPILEKIVEKICAESTKIANTANLNLYYNDMINETKKVIKETSENYSSMLQSIQKNKKTEIESINGVIVELGEKSKMDVSLNNTLVNLIKNY